MTITTLRAAILGSAAALSLNACGGTDAESPSAKTEKIVASAASNASPLDAPFRLKNAEAVDVGALMTALDLDETVTIGASSFDSELGATILTDVAVAGEDATTIGRVEIYGLDTDAVEALNAGETFDQPKEVFRKLRFFDIESSYALDTALEMADMDANADASAPQKGTVTIAAMELDGLSLQGQGPDSPDEEASPEDQRKFFAAAAQSMAFGGMAMKGLNYAMEGNEGEGEMGLTVTADDVRAGAYKDGRFAGLYMRDMDYSFTRSEEAVAEQLAALGPQAGMIMNTPLKSLMFPETQAGTVREFSWDGFSMEGLLSHLEKGEEPPLNAKGLLSVGELEILDQTVMVNGKLAATVKRSAMDPIQFHHFMPKQIKFVSEGAVTDLTAYVDDTQEEIRSVLEKNGLQSVEGSSKMVYTYDPKSGGIDITSSGKGDGLYAMDFDLKVTDFDYESLASSQVDEAGKEAALQNLKINNVTLRLDDDKMLDTIFAVVGVANDQDPAQLRSQAMGLLALGALQGAQISPRISQYATALSSFVGEGGTLEVKVAPDAPVTLGELAEGSEGQPAAMLDLLNLTVERSD